jgi:hypothetical protein
MWSSSSLNVYNVDTTKPVTVTGSLNVSGTLRVNTSQSNASALFNVSSSATYDTIVGMTNTGISVAGSPAYYFRIDGQGGANAPLILEHNGWGAQFNVNAGKLAIGKATSGSATLDVNGNAVVSGNLIVNGVIQTPVVALQVSKSATCVLNPTASSIFTLLVSGTFTLSASTTNAFNGQMFSLRMFNNSSSAVTPITSSQFRWGTDITGFTGISSGKADAYVFMYVATSSQWEVYAMSRGY